MATATATRKPKSIMKRRPAAKPRSNARPKSNRKQTPVPNEIEVKMDASAKFMHELMPSIRLAVPSTTTAARIQLMVLQELRKNPNLLTASGVQRCIISAARLGLEPGVLQQCHLIPRAVRDRNDYKKILGYECTLMLGYEGMIDIMHRAGGIRSITAEVVYKGERFEVTQGSAPSLLHVPVQDKRDNKAENIVAAYCMMYMKQGPPQFVVLNKARIEKSRLAGAKTGVPWMKSYAAMAAKSAVREAWKYVRKSGALVVEGVDMEAIEVDSVATTICDEPVAFVTPSLPSRTQEDRATLEEMCAEAGITPEQLKQTNTDRDKAHRAKCTIARNAKPPQQMPPAPKRLTPAEAAGILGINEIEDVETFEQQEDQDVVAGVHGMDGDGKFTKAMGTWHGKNIEKASLLGLRERVKWMENQKQLAELKVILEARIEELEKSA